MAWPNRDDNDDTRKKYEKDKETNREITENRGGTQEFELRSIKFKKYISGSRSIFLFQKKHNFA